MKTKLIFSILGLLFSINLSAQTFSGGSGTQSDPYKISTKADMEALAAAVEDWQSYSGKYFKLQNSLTGSNALTKCVSFDGIFDGGGYEIELNNVVGGAFELRGATIYNLSVKGFALIGGICGRATNSTIMHCCNLATITGESYAGGICGETRGTTTISHCYNLGSVSVSSSNGAYVGGICGYDGMNSYDNTNITDCYNLGNVSSSAYNGSSAGGICGISEGNITNCYNLGTVSSATQLNYGYNGTLIIPYAGGICGSLTYGMIANCFAANTALFTLSTNRSSGAGRIYGYSYSSTIENCYALSSMTLNGLTGSSTNANSIDGADALMSNFQSQSWIQSNLGWDFENIWSMSNINDPVFQGLPIFKYQQKPTFTIFAMTGSGGTILPSGSIAVTQGENQHFDFVPNTGYEIDQVLVDGVSNASAVSAGSYTFVNVTANHTISVSFKLKQYTITATAGIGGAISPDGLIMVIHGNDQTFTFTPNTGYEIDQVLVDGVNDASAVSAGSYTFTNVTDNQTIAVSFKLKQYIISASAGNYGSISPSGQVIVLHGSSQTFTFTPNERFQINRVLVNGQNNNDAVSSGSYTFTDIALKYHSISVTFKLESYPTYSGGNGSKDNPYLISSKADMEVLAAAVEEGQSYSGEYFKLQNSLTGSNALTTTVDGISSRFGGNFDGNGYEIELNNANGVFGYISGATIHNLKVKGSVLSDQSDAGGICGYAINSTITLCCNSATVSGDTYAAGICGRASNSTIMYCYNSATITGEYAGGICGEVTGGTTIITNCYNLGDVSGIASYNSYAGGICGKGESNTNITNCYNLGDVSSFSHLNSSSYTGGICGFWANITNCFAANTTLSSSQTNDIVRISGYPYTINNCYALSSMTINGTTVSSTDVNSKNGADALMSNFQSQSWIQSNLGWDFENIWTMSNVNDPVFQGLPIFKYQPKPTFTISASVTTGGGTISPSGSVTVTQGENQRFDFTSNTGYEIDQVLVDNSPNEVAKANGYYTFTNVTNNHTIVISFKAIVIPTYTITASVTTDGGSISPNGTQTVNHGDDQQFDFTPNTGYEINQVLIDGVPDETAKASGSYTFTNVTANHTIAVSFKVKQYTITVSIDGGGNIDPPNSVTLNHGNNQTFTFAPNFGYEINQVLIDGAPNEAAKANGSYTFTNVTANHTIAVSFKVKQYTITVSIDGGGNIDPPNSVTLNHGDSQTFTFAPNFGYEINQVLIDNFSNETAKATGSYTFTNVTSNHTIAVTFKLKTFTITASIDGGGNIDPPNSVTLNHGDNQTFTFVPNFGYEINQVLIDGVPNEAAKANGSYTFTNVTANHTSAVSFKLKT
jgi:hypothetical protein